MTQHTASIALVGLGPRGVSTLERLIAYLNSATEHPDQLELHLIDDAQHGGGKIWDINQTKVLCMNTFAHGMTLFSEPGATVNAPVVEGPTIYEWVQLLLDRTDNIAQPKLDYVADHPLDKGVVDEFGRHYLESVRPESYPLRALYGHYLQWFFRSILSDVPEWVEVTEHFARATELSDEGDHDVISLNNGKTITADATIAVTGWQNQGYTGQEDWIRKTMNSHPDLRWIRADNPIDQDIDGIRDNEEVLVRGLGMGFFDVAILCTQGRGGQFVEDDSKPWGLRYEGTGKEPTFYASSRRGYPFMPQSDDRGLPQPAGIPRLRETVAELSDREAIGSINYDTEVWPSVLRDAYQAYLETLNRVQPEAIRTSLEEAIAALDDAEINAAAVFNGIKAVDEVIKTHTTQDFSLLKWIHLLPAHFDTPAELNAYLVERMVEDLRDSEKGPDSPVRAALWSIGFSRKPTQVLGAEGRYNLESRHHMFSKAVNLGQLSCSGPPIFRTRQLLALVDAGIVHFVGGYPLLDTDRKTGEWTMSSPSSGGYRFRGTTLLDAWVHKPDIRRRPADAFSASLLDSGRIQPFTEPSAEGADIPTGSPAQDPQSRRTINASGKADPRLHIVGIPAHAEYPDTTISPPLPGTDSWFLQETDKAAVSAARLVLGQ
ncbi:MAG: FAD/NAD(P)-binding protein [Corynebacterium camporealensis]|uniref:FAD/NAD(P)-binding protein n=1 Tax=Corynebacterium camporealensis TaxID=161896 RepID=UPI002A916625|nr:FAD/NAD(P)-binding protein [Corynebacterium camporealensis]MDY5839941.1 FAD/NAD(P)-binding protein [Corynebacterium camporealensis]